MSLFTVNRYLGESPSASDTPPSNQQQSILDKINARAKARQEQRRSAPQGNTTPAAKSKVDDPPPDTSRKVAPVTPTFSPDSTKLKKKKKLATKQESNDADSQEKDSPTSSFIKTDSAKRTKKKPKMQVESTDDDELRLQALQKENKSRGKDDVPMATGRGTTLTAKERKQRVIDQGLVPKDSVVKKKKGKRKSDGGKEKDDEASNTQSERTKKARLEAKDGDAIEHYPSPAKNKKGRRKSVGGKGEDDDMSDSQIRTRSDTEDVESIEKSPSLEKKEGKKETMIDSSQTHEDEDENKRTNAGSDGEDEEEEMEVEEEEEDEEEAPNFVVLGDFERKHKKKVYETLPDWLAKPSVIKRSLTDDLLPVTSVKGLDERLITALTAMGVTKFFPVQQHVIPTLLQSLRYGIHTGNAGYRPRDLCISAPTGSGKTLAFAIPIIQALMDRVVCRVRALVVLPTRDLATQVYKIISALCKATPLNAVLIGGTKKFAQEQSQLVRESDGEFHSLADIVVATPGRLVDNLTQTKGFNLQHLRFLVIDEADRLMEHISQDWITQVEKSAYTPQFDNGTFLPSFTSCRQRPGPLTVNRSSTFQLPLQKLLFSATLSQNPEKLTQLRLFQPRLITTAMGNKAPPPSGWNLDGGNEGEMEEDGGKEGGRTDFVGKYTTPHGLSEYYVQCTAGEKPLVLQHFLCNLYFKQVLCFTNSIQATHRLYLLFKLMGGVDVAEFSSNLSQSERQNILKRFKAGKIQILICSDAMARGMDIENVKCVISYDVPPHLKTYIHRVGRTARAGRSGTAFSFVRKKEIKEFKHMLRNAGKEGIQRHTVSTNQLEALTPAYTDALSRLSSMLREEKAHQY